MGAINLSGGGGKKILQQVHKHHNMQVLDDLNDKNGLLTYKGEEILTTSTNSRILATQVIETDDRKFVNKQEKEALFGVQGNIQAQLNINKILAEERVRFRGRFNSYSDMLKNISDPMECDMAFIDNDETQSNVSTIYYYTEKKWLRVRKDSGSGGWIASNVEPANTSLLWVDVSQADPVLKYFNGMRWVDISGLKEVPASKVVQETNLRFVTDKSDAILSNMSEDSKTGLLTYKGNIIGIGSGGVNIDDTVIDTDSTFSSFKINDLLKAKQDDLGYIPENISKKGKKDGYAPLNSLAKVSKDYLTLFNYCVSDIQARDNIVNPEHGSVCYIDSTKELFVRSLNNQWILIAKGNSIDNSKNNYKGTRNPVADDDVTQGYTIGSIWVNTYTKKAFICTNSDIGNAIWELMAGSITLNIGEIIPFKLDPVGYVKEGSKFKYTIQKMNLETDYIELTVNGHELIKDVHYTFDEDDDNTYILLDEELTATDYIFGEIYKHDIKKAEEQMLKSVYDSNDNGKVDLAEISDRSKGLLQWTPETGYKTDDLIFKDGSLFYPVSDHLSSSVYESAKWERIIAEPVNLKNFTTNDLAPTTNRQYLSQGQVDNVNRIPSLISRMTSAENSITSNRTSISNLNTKTNQIQYQLNTLRFTDLVDTPSSLPPNAFFRVNSSGTGIITDTKALFSIDKVIDSSDRIFNSVSELKFKNMKMEKINGSVFNFSIDASSVELNDMPKVHQHGKVLVSDQNNNKYVLADKEELTMSIENFAHTILEEDWIEKEGKYEVDIFHDMASINLVVSFTDKFLVEDKTISYSILDNKNIKVISNERKEINCVINCSLGAGNGYWQYLMDWEKIDFVDDTKIRLDRAYSSKKLEDILNLYALKSDYFTRNVCDTRYALKTLEHDHTNKKVLDSFSVDEAGDIQFNSRKLLYELNPTSISIESDFDFTEITEMHDLETIYKENNLQAIIASEVIVKNIGEKEATFTIKDGLYTLINIRLDPNEVQKYQLGISNKVKILGNGNMTTMLTVSGF